MTATCSAHSWLRILFLLLVLPGAAFAQGAAPVTQARPALWKVENAGATVYLFGSLHILPNTIDWTTPEIDAAMAGSDVFVFEVPIDEQAVAAEKDFVIHYGLLSGPSNLRNVLTRREYLIYSTVLLRAGLKPEQFARYRPWLASVILGLAYLHPDNIAELSGADDLLIDYAHTHGKEVRYLETVEEQMTLLTGPSDVAGVLSLKRLIRTLPQTRAQSQQLLDLWSAGDAERLGRQVDSYFTGYTMSEDSLIGNRNRDWVARIKEMLSESGKTSMVTVGAAHIGGAHGLIALLCSEGYEVDRLGMSGAPGTNACNAINPASEPNR
jgi:uncharacterized protein YbaP (TraB family)